MLLHRQYSTRGTEQGSTNMPEFGRRSPHNQIRRAKPVHCRPDKQAGTCRILWCLDRAWAKGSGFTRVCLDWWHSARVFGMGKLGTRQQWRFRKLCYIYIRLLLEWSWMRLFWCIWKTRCCLPEAHMRRPFSSALQSWYPGSHIKVIYEVKDKSDYVIA